MITRVYEVECDDCKRILALTVTCLNMAKDRARRRGWRLGKQHKCPRCVRAEKDLRT